MNRIKEIETRLAAIEIEIKSDGADLEKLDKEVDDLKEERGKLLAQESRQKLLDKIAKSGAPARTPEDNEILEQRGADLRSGKKIVLPAAETRSMLLANTDVILEQKYNRDLPAHPLESSSLVDRVKSFDLGGGESYTRGFALAGMDADYTSTENGTYNDSALTFGHVTIGKSKITVYTEISRDFSVLPNINYAGMIQTEIRDAIRKKIGKQIILGAGTTGTIRGIYNADAACAVSDLAVSAIGVDTLTDLVFALGGDEDVHENAVLILNKTDLQAFTKVRGTNEKKPVYTATMNGNTGTIGYADGGITVPYIINSAAKATATASVDDYTMIFGALNTYELPIFSQMAIEESRDFKFSTGMVAYRGDVFVGGAVAAYKSFVRAKKSN